MPIRKRPVSFGNPALGTYKGFVYTLEGTKSTSQKPLVEGAEAVDRMVAMVNVPPEQVPEGILNLARSHRRFIEHVRIVIGEPEQKEEEEDATRNTSKRNLAAVSEQEELVVATSSVYSTTCNNNNNPSPLMASAMERAASILAADEASAEQQQQTAEDPLAAPPQASSSLPFMATSLKWSESSDVEDRPNRSYLVLIHLQTEQDAETMVEDLHGRPYTSLDETVTCSVHTVVALQGQDGVSLLNPMFAPSTKKKKHGALEILPSTSSNGSDQQDDDGHDDDNDDDDPDNTTLKPATSNTPHHLTEDPNCAVCLEHMSLDPNAEDKTSILTTVCNHTFHLDCLVQCQDSPCPVCRYDHSGLNETLSQCHICGTTERNYVCLICGVVSCVSGTSAAVLSPHHRRRGVRDEERDSCGGAMAITTTGEARAAATTTSSSRPYHSQVSDESIESSEATARRFYTSHANQHYDETLHAYALDTETQHVWDFAGQGYVHRLLQNKEDGKLVEVSDPNNTTSQERSLTPGLSDAQEGEVVHRKLEGFASQYYTLLKSQLEQQRTFYEGRLQEIRREFSIKKANAASDKADLITVLKQEKKQLSQRLQSLKRKHLKVKEDVAFLKSMNESLEANKAPLTLKIKQAQREQIESREMFQMYLPALEEKVTALMLQLEESLGGASESKREN